MINKEEKSTLDFTGERFVPGQINGIICAEHNQRYYSLQRLVEGKKVLDAACGAGYGSAIMAQTASYVFGVDISIETINYDKAIYKHVNNLKFKRASIEKLPFEDESFDVIVSFETIEHVGQEIQNQFLKEIKRCLKRNGILVMSSPNKKTYSDARKYKNEFHVHEFYFDEFEKFLKREFMYVNFYSQGNYIIQSEILKKYNQNEIRKTNKIYLFNDFDVEKMNELYFIAVCSNEQIPDDILNNIESIYNIPKFEAVAYGEDKYGKTCKIIPQSSYDNGRYMAFFDISKEKYSKIWFSPNEGKSCTIKIVNFETDIKNCKIIPHNANIIENDVYTFYTIYPVFDVVGDFNYATYLSVNYEASEIRSEQLCEKINLLESQQQEYIEASEIRSEQLCEKINLLESQQQEYINKVQLEKEKNNQLMNKISGLHDELMNTKSTISIMKNSTSWRITRPCRAIGKIARGDLKGTVISFKPYVKKYGYDFYMKLPLSQSTKKRMKEVVFQKFPYLFDDMAQYKLWKSKQQISSDRKKIDINLLKDFANQYSDISIFFSAEEKPLVSVIIPVYSGFNDLENCLKSLVVCSVPNLAIEVILVDDCPNDQVTLKIPDSPGLIKLYNEQNLGFLLTCNKGAKIARGKYLCFLNSDTVVFPNWLNALINALENNESAVMAGGMLLNNDGTIQDAGWRILKNGWGEAVGRGEDPNNGAYTYNRVTDCVTGACFLIYKKIFEKLGGLDEEYKPAFYEEFDLAFRIKREGWNVIYAPKCKVLHLGSSSYGAERRDELSNRNHKKFVKRYKDLLKYQPSNNEKKYMLRQDTKKQPSILMIDLSVPHPDRHAGDVTIGKYLNLLVELGWHVIYAPVDGEASDDIAKNFEDKGIEFIRKPQNVVEWLKENGEFLQYVWIARPDVAEGLLDEIKNYTDATIVYYTHDLHFLRMERDAMVHNSDDIFRESQIMKQKEIAIFKKVNEVISPSSSESEIIRTLVDNVNVNTVLPYFYLKDEIKCYDEKHFNMLQDILFVGGFPHKPNVDSAIYIVNDVMPSIWKKFPKTKLILVGYAPPPEIESLANSRVIVTGQVPEIESYFYNARLFLAPLTYGAGVKGKIVQALQNGMPVVTNSIGIEGIPQVENGKNIIVADSTEEIIKNTIELLQNSKKCESLSVHGSKLIYRNFSYDNAKNKISKILINER